MDVLSDVLNAVRLSGSVLFTAECTAPFDISVPPSEQFATLLVPGARRLILFHLILDGRCTVRAGNDAPREVAAGDMLLLPYGDAFSIGDDGGALAHSIFELVPPLPWSGPPQVRCGGGGHPLMRLLCGFLHADELLVQPLLAGLPPLLVIRGDDAMPRLRGLQHLLAEDVNMARPGGAAVVRRGVELLFVESLRHVLTMPSAGPAPPLAAIGDAVVGRALAALHADPARPWTVQELARTAATSRSLLADRFARLVGCPPMDYLARWRMQLAARRMLERPDALADIAAAVGYTSDNGFNRTFRRHFGIPPARWRKAHKPAAT